MTLDEIIVHTMSHLEVSGVLESHCNDVLKGKAKAQIVQLSKEGELFLSF